MEAGTLGRPCVGIAGALVSVLEELLVLPPLLEPPLLEPPLLEPEFPLKGFWVGSEGV